MRLLEDSRRRWQRFHDHQSRESSEVALFFGADVLQIISKRALPSSLYSVHVNVIKYHLKILALYRGHTYHYRDDTLHGLCINNVILSHALNAMTLSRIHVKVP